MQQSVQRLQKAQQAIQALARQNGVSLVEGARIARRLCPRFGLSDSETELVNGLGGLLVGSIPEAAHSVLEVLLNWVGISNAVTNIDQAFDELLA